MSFYFEIKQQAFLKFAIYADGELFINRNLGSNGKD